MQIRMNVYVITIKIILSSLHKVNKHGVSRRWFTEAHVKDFKSDALRTTTNIISTGFDLSVSRSRNTIYFSIIVIPNYSHFTTLAIQNFVQNEEQHVNSTYIVGIMLVR